MGFFFFGDNLTPLLVLGRRVQAGKETTHTMMNDDGKQHREVNNNMKNIGWGKKVECEVVHFGISRLLANVAFG